MNIFGKIVGAIFGFMLGNVFGAIIGVIIGHMFDRGLTARLLDDYATFNNQHEVQDIFFRSLFSVLGYIAKADGRVSEDEIALARAIMRDMSLDETRKQTAINLFNQGKQPDFDLEGTLTTFKRACRLRNNLLRMFLEVLIHAAFADGVMHPKEQKALQHISMRLGFSLQQYAQLEAMVQAQRSFHQGGFHTGDDRQYGSQRGYSTSHVDKLAAAYQVLGVSESASDSEVKKAYRRLLNQHHPDKLVAKGLPEDMIKLANEKTHEITAAYDVIKNARGM